MRGSEGRAVIAHEQSIATRTVSPRSDRRGREDPSRTVMLKVGVPPIALTTKCEFARLLTRGWLSTRPRVRGLA